MAGTWLGHDGGGRLRLCTASPLLPRLLVGGAEGVQHIGFRVAALQVRGDPRDLLFGQLGVELGRFLQLVVAHNWDFDKNGLRWFNIELGADQGTFCTMLALAHDGRKWPRLEEAVAAFGVGVDGSPHRAETDARSAGRLFIEMVRRGY